MTTKPAATRQADLKVRRLADGQRRIPIWVRGEDLAVLRSRFPGPRGGVDWQRVIDRAVQP